MSAIETTQPAGLAPATVDPRFRNASMQSWNVNVQRQLVARPGRDHRLFRLTRREPAHLAQSQSAGCRRAAIPRRWRPPARFFPAQPLGNITQVESSGFSNYYGAVGGRDQAPVARSAVRYLLHAGRSRSTPTRSIRPASPFRTATTFPASTACPISMLDIDSS